MLRVSRRITICPTWREHTPQDGERVIMLDPGMAFGTGHHPTTRMCLEQLDELVGPGIDVLDVGCGSGVLSIAAARLGAEACLRSGDRLSGGECRKAETFAITA